MKFRDGSTTETRRWWASPCWIANWRLGVLRDRGVKAQLISQLVRWCETTLVSRRRLARILPRWTETVVVVSAPTVRLNSAPFQASIYSISCVSRFPHLRTHVLLVDASWCYLASYCPMIRRFRFLHGMSLATHTLSFSLSHTCTLSAAFYYRGAFTKGAWTLVSHPALWMGVYRHFQQMGDRYKRARLGAFWTMRPDELPRKGNWLTFFALNEEKHYVILKRSELTSGQQVSAIRDSQEFFSMPERPFTAWTLEKNICVWKLKVRSYYDVR